MIKHFVCIIIMIASITYATITFASKTYETTTFALNLDSLVDIYKVAFKGTLKEFQKSTIRRILTNKKEFYITLDLCDGNKKNFDTSLFLYLQKNQIPVSIFVTKKWIDKNKKSFLFLCAQQNFSIQNHGTNHLVPSFQKKQIFGVPCVKNVKELAIELYATIPLIETYSHKKPCLYRPATIYHDSLSISLANAMGMQVIAYTITSYNGVTQNRNTKNLAQKLSTKLCPGAIILIHGNHPKWNEKDLLERFINHAYIKGYKIAPLINNFSRKIVN